jgi:hypothetical protein
MKGIVPKSWQVDRLEEEARQTHEESIQEGRNCQSGYEYREQGCDQQDLTLGHVNRKKQETNIPKDGAGARMKSLK